MVTEPVREGQEGELCYTCVCVLVVLFVPFLGWGISVLTAPAHITLLIRPTNLSAWKKKSESRKKKTRVWQGKGCSLATAGFSNPVLVCLTYRSSISLNQIIKPEQINIMLLSHRIMLGILSKWEKIMGFVSNKLTVMSDVYLFPDSISKSVLK